MVSRTNEIVASLNRIRDNLWLSDFKEAKNIADSILGGKEGALERLQEEQEKVKQIRKDARELPRKKRKHWVANEMHKNFKNRKAVVNYLEDTLVSRIRMIQDDLHPSDTDDIFRRNTYKYRLITRPPDYEIRALLVGTVKKLNDQDAQSLARQLESERPYMDKNKSSATLRFFTPNEFIKVTLLPSSVEINIAMGEPNDERAKQIGETILSNVSAEVVSRQR